MSVDVVFACAAADDQRIATTVLCPYEDGESLDHENDVPIVMLSYIYATMGAYLCVMCIRRLHFVRDPCWFGVLSAVAGISLGGVGVWTMHFVGMKAMRLGNKKVQLQMGALPGAAATAGELTSSTKEVQTIIEVEFEGFMTVTSLIAASALSGLGIGYTSYRDYMFVGHNFVASEKRIRLTTFVLAAGVCVMHFMGMWSQTGNIEMHWNAGFILLSILIANVVVYVGLQILYNEHVVPSVRNQFIAALVIGAAVCSMHYTGMHAATYTFRADGRRDTGVDVFVAKFGSAYWITIVAGILKFVLQFAPEAYDRYAIESLTDVVEGLLLLMYKNGWGKQDETGEFLPNGIAAVDMTASTKVMTGSHGLARGPGSKATPKSDSGAGKQAVPPKKTLGDLEEFLEKGLDVHGWLLVYHQELIRQGGKEPAIFHREKREQVKKVAVVIDSLLDQDAISECSTNAGDGKQNTRRSCSTNAGDGSANEDSIESEESTEQQPSLSILKETDKGIVIKHAASSASVSFAKARKGISTPSTSTAAAVQKQKSENKSAFVAAAQNKEQTNINAAEGENVAAVKYDAESETNVIPV